MTISYSDHFELPSEIAQVAAINLSRLFQASLAHLCPAPPQSLAEWMENNVRLPAVNSDTAGDFSFYYVPHMLGVCAAMEDDSITDIYCMKASQVAWTTVLLAYLMFRIDLQPSAIIGMFSAVDAAREFSMEKLTPMVEGCEVVASKMDVSTTRRTGNSLLHRDFPGGFLKLIGSNAIRSMKSTPAPFVFVEEPDDAAENVQGQGDSVTVLFNRTKRFRKPKRILGGTPSIKNFSRVEARLDLTDLCVLPVECHACDEAHVLDFANVKWLESEDESAEPHPVYGRVLTETAGYGCPFCGDLWTDSRRQENIRDTVFRARDAGDPFCGWTPTRKTGGRIKGFSGLSELYSCLPGSSVRELLETYLEAEYYANQGDETKRISFVNNQEGKPYEYKDERPDADALRDRIKEDPESQRDEFLCPADGLLVTVGIDVQHDRVAVAVRAWGPNDRSWLLHWGEISASSTCVDKGDPVWTSLDQAVFRAFPHEGEGSAQVSIYASAISIDSSDGQTSDAVYDWVRTRQAMHPNRLIMAIKGSSARQDPEIFTQPKLYSIDHKRHDKKTKAQRHGVKVYMVGTNKAKDWIAAHMALPGPNGGYHYYRHDQMRWDYADQMMGEAKIPHKTVRNRKVWTQKNGHAIEAWDCEVYALHAARAKRAHLMKHSEWLGIKAQLLQSDLFSTAGEPPAGGTIKRRKSDYWNR